MCWSLFFGIFLIIFGVFTLINVIFHINIPLFSIAFGIFLLYLGIRCITGFPRSCCFNSREAEGIFMGNAHFRFADEHIKSGQSQLIYKTIFGKSKIDLSSLTATTLLSQSTPLIATIDTVFGKTELLLNKKIPTHIIAKSTFAKTLLPDKTMISFGSHTYSSNLNQQPLIIIYSTTVFGEIKIEERE